MDIIRVAAQVVTRTADVTAGAAGAVGGAAITGVIGGVQGTVAGIRSGLSSGSHSTPAAVLTLGAVGASGLVEWPVLLGVGGTALLIRQLNQRSGRAADSTTDSTPRARTRRSGPAKKATARTSARRKS
jgi:hypothetical protein